MNSDSPSSHAIVHPPFQAQKAILRAAAKRILHCGRLLFPGAAAVAILIGFNAVGLASPETSAPLPNESESAVNAKEIRVLEREAKEREKAAKEKQNKIEERAATSTKSANVTAATVTSQVTMQPATQTSSFNYLMAHYNAGRQGWISNETLLTPVNVNCNNTVGGTQSYNTPAPHNFNTPTAGFFGEIWNSQQFANTPNLFATPLYVDSITMGSGTTYAGATLSVTYCATGQCDLYAVCASGTVFGSTPIPAGTVLWHTNLGTSNVTLDNANVGIFGTPIIDLSATPPRMYVTCSCRSSPYTSQTSGWLAFAVDITTGIPLPNWPVPINNSTLQPVMQNGLATFTNGGLQEGSRGALNLSSDGTILYIPISDVSTVTGFMVTVQTNGTPKVASAFAAMANAPNSGSGNYYVGLWSAAGASIDPSGNVYACTGDYGASGASQFTANQDRPVGCWGMTMLVFQPTATLALKGTYNPWNYQSMDVNDVDMATTPIMIPDLPGLYPHCVAFGSKGGTIYLVNRDTLQQDATSPSFTNQRPASVNGTDFRSNVDETSFVPPTTFPQYTNSGHTPSGATGPLNVFGPATEGNNGTTFAKSRTSPCAFQGPDGNFYVVYTGQTKNGTSALPPGIARLKVNTFSNSTPYLTVDGTDTSDVIENAGSPVVSSNGTSNPIVWMLDEDASRSATLPGTHPYLLGIDAMSMTTLYKAAVSKNTKDGTSGGPSTLHAGGKYNEPSVIRGKVFVGTDRLQAFGITSYVYAVGCGGPGGAGNTSTTLSPVMPDGSTHNTITTTFGKTFTADNYVSGGVSYSPSPATIDVSPVSNPAPQVVYQNARVGSSPTTGFTYTFPNLTPGANYSVRLHFAEINVPVLVNGVPTGGVTSGQRVFNVSINGTQVLTNYDIYATCSGGNVACEECFGAIADVNAGTITIAFSPKSGSANPPMVNGIEINALPDSIGQEYWFDWLAQYGLRGAAASPTANALNDGIPNVWKYFTNANPATRGNPATLLPQMSIAPSGGSNYLQFTYRRRIDYSTRGFSVAVQTSPSLSPASWTTQPATQVGTPTPTGDGVTETAVIQLNSPIASNATQLYARVQLTLANN